MNVQLHLFVPFVSERAKKRFRDFPTIIHTQETLPTFQVKGTKFIGKTATYFDHKVPVDESTIECIGNGKLITGEESEFSFVKPITPPYKLG